jgi:hypothetical protein
MKKLFLTLVFSSVMMTAINAQQYYPLLDSTNFWHYTANYLPVRMQSTQDCPYPMYFDMGEGHFTGADTIINAYTYKQLYAGGSSNPCRFGYLREDTAGRKVYFKDNTGAPEILLYDFSMQVNDSILVSFITNNGYFDSGYYKLDSITTVTIAAGQRRKFHLNCSACNPQNTLSWIESVGNQLDLVYPYFSNIFSGGGMYNCNGGIYNSFQFLICLEQKNIKSYIDSCALNDAMTNGCILFIDSCHYGNICSAIDDNNLLQGVSVSPNPNNGNLTISMELRKESDAELFLYDIYGRRTAWSIRLGHLPAGKTEKQIALNDLAAGVYFIECRTAAGSAFQKIIIQ